MVEIITPDFFVPLIDESYVELIRNINEMKQS